MCIVKLYNTGFGSHSRLLGSLQGHTSSSGEHVCVIDDTMQQTLAQLAPYMDVSLFPKACFQEGQMGQFTARLMGA